MQLVNCDGASADVQTNKLSQATKNHTTLYMYHLTARQDKESFTKNIWSRTHSAEMMSQNGQKDGHSNDASRAVIVP